MATKAGEKQQLENSFYSYKRKYFTIVSVCSNMLFRIVSLCLCKSKAETKRQTHFLLYMYWNRCRCRYWRCQKTLPKNHTGPVLRAHACIHILLFIFPLLKIQGWIHFNLCPKKISSRFCAANEFTYEFPFFSFCSSKKYICS